MVEVFKTNVQHPGRVKKLVGLLIRCFPGNRVNFDMDDCDKILRVENNNIAPLKIIRFIKQNGFECGLLV